MIKLVGVKSGEKYFITRDSGDGYRRYSLPNRYIINSGKIEKSFHKNWGVLSTEVKTVQEVKSQPDINHRYELRDLSLESDKIPLLLMRDEISYYDSDSYEWIWNKQYSMYQSMYELKSDNQPNLLVDVEFEYETIMEFDGLLEHSGFGYEVFKTQWEHEGYRILDENSIKHQLIDEMIFPEIILPSRPCSLSRKQTFDIIRVYIKQNINFQRASITSDYDFCFTVKKKIDLSEEEKYSVDVNWAKKTKRKKFETRYKRFREIEIFDMAPKPYQNYRVIDGFIGENEKDLKSKIDSYCKDLVDYINEPVSDCPHCKGRGVETFTEEPERGKEDS